MAKADAKAHGGASEAGREPELEAWSGAVFREWLERSELTDSDAARLFGVTVTTLGNWNRSGPAAPAERFVRYLERNGIHPAIAAAQIGVKLSGRLRSAYREQSAQAASSSPMHAVPEGAERKRFQWEKPDDADLV